MNTGIPQEQLNELNFSNILLELQRMNWVMIIPVFVICFLGGYFIYASLFAAMGAAMGDDMGESQSLMIPIIIPVLIAFTMLLPIMNNPNGKLAIFGSMFPLFSPILLPARLAFDPPWWQIVISILLLIGTVIGMIWLTGRIYRVGILLYGKKTSLKEVAKWMFYKS
jgi:ABC-2 type transport system permease protein